LLKRFEEFQANKPMTPRRSQAKPVQPVLSDKQRDYASIIGVPQDHRFNISFTLASGTYAIQEQFSDFADQLGLTFDFSITAVSDTSVAATASFSYSTGSQSINFNGGGTIRDSTQNVQGTVRVNGQVFAVITAVGPRSALPTITDAHGQPLSGDDAVLLYQMFVIVGRSLKWLNYLVGSFVSLTGIGVLLNV